MLTISHRKAKPFVIAELVLDVGNYINYNDYFC